MWRLVLTVVLLSTISSQPVTDDLQNSRPPREVDFVACCPCPGSSRAGEDLGAAASSDALARAPAVDDCPCRLLEPDTQGSPSLFLPRAVRPVRPFMTPEAPKEDVKPLLKPEVGLASSMLETLREVTDEEYQEALARDAARNAARVAELEDAQPETAKNVVTIIVNPKDDNDDTDATPEASQSFKTSCVHPSGSLGQVREAEEIFKLQPDFRGTLLDMDSGASEVKQSVVGLNKGLEGLRLKTTPSLLKLFPPRKSEGNIQSLLKFKNNKDQDVPKKMDSVKPTLPKRKFGSIFRKMGEDESTIRPRSPLDLSFTKLNMPKIRTTLARKPKVNQFGNDDSNPSPSIIQEQFSAPVENKNTGPFNLKSLFPPTPFNLKNFLNLKDVELIPPKSTKITLPDLKLLPPLRTNKPETKFIKQRKSERLTEECNAKAREETIDVQENQRIHTEILDSIPHASETNPIMVVNDQKATAIKNINKNMMSKDDNIKTDILDALPSASDTNEFVDDNESVIETSTPRLEEETTNSDGDLEPQNFEETVTEPTHKLSKDNIKIMDTNDNNNNEISQFEEFEVPQDQPMSGIDGEGLNLEINEDDTNFASSEFTFSLDDGESVSIEELNEGEFESEPVQETEEENELDFIPDMAFNPVQETEEVKESESEPVQGIDVLDFIPDMEFNPVQETEEVKEFESEPVQRIDVSDDITNEETLFTRDAAAETSNQNIQIASQELSEERSNTPSDTLSKEESSLTQKLEYAPKSDFLSSLKEKISIKLNSLKNPDTKIVAISRFNKPASEKSAFNSNEFSEVKPLTKDTEKFIVDEKFAEITTRDTNQVDMQDLQHMSDSLLIKSEKKTTPKLIENLKGKTTLDDTSVKTDKSMASETFSTNLNNNKENGEEHSDMDSSATSLKETFDFNEASHEDFDQTDESIINFNDSNLRTDVGDTTLNTEDATDSTCPSNLQSAESVTYGKTEKSFSNLPNNGETEMESGASETVFNTARIPSSPLLHQSIVVQPASLFPPLPNLDLSNVNLPTLDDIREGISNILGENSRASEDEEVLNTSDECPDSNPVMSSDASTTNLKSVLPTFRPLQDINLDIFQINPQSIGSPLSSKLPSLNLNSFKTKLALPKTLELKPMKLQSTLGGRNGGLLGASFTFGPDKASLSRKVKPKAKLGSILNLQGSDILRTPLSSMPSLEDFRATMRANTGTLPKSLLTSPLEDTFRTTEAFSNSLRSHTENTMRNIQQSLSSTLNEARVSNAGEKFAKPEDLLEMVSSAHEDVKDKLYGIHVDLQDRLSSMHDSILDHTNLQIPKLQMPLLSSLGRLQDSPLIRSRARNDLKKTPSPKLIVRKRKPTAKVNKSISKHKEQNKVIPFKMSKAASSLTPKTVDVPKLMATSSKPPFLRPLQRDESVKLKETKPLFANDKRKISKNKIQTKETIGTTPRPASIRTRPTLRSQLVAKSVPVHKDQRLGNQRVGQFKSFSDSRGFASEPQAMKVPAPFKPISSAEFLTSNSVESREALQARPSPYSLSSLPQFSLRNPLLSRTLPTLKSIAPIKLPAPKTTLTPLTLPKPTESPIISKMRESIRIRLSRPVQSSNKLRNEAVSKPHGKEEMARSASETNSVAVRAGPMKENVSYKCKMVCVRE